MKEVINNYFYVGKTKFFIEICKFCGEDYTGQGKTYCSYSCCRKDNPIAMFGDDSPTRRPEVRKKISESKKGIRPSDKTIAASIKAHKGFFGKDAKNGRWIEDRSLIKRQDERNNPEYKQWRLKVYIRDNYKCRMNNEDCFGKIVAHHILGWTAFPKLRHIINNGITLCKHHHPRKRKDEKRLIPTFEALVGSCE